MAWTAATYYLVSALLADFPVIPDPLRAEALSTGFEITGAQKVPLSNPQRIWDQPVLDIESSAVWETAVTHESQARLRASSRPESGACFSAPSSPNLGTLMDFSTIRITVCLCLGLPLCQSHKCRCGSQADQFGTHGFSCMKNAGQIPRHIAINETIKRALASVNVPSQLEHLGIYRQDGKEPDSLSLVPWSRGKFLFWDATCTDTLAKSYVKGRCSGCTRGNQKTQQISHWSPHDVPILPFCR